MLFLLMQGGSLLLTTSPSHLLLSPLPSPRLPFLCPCFDWSRGMVIFMHHLGQQDGRTSSNYLKQTRRRLVEKLPLYLSSRNKKTDWEHNGFKTHSVGFLIHFEGFGLHLRWGLKQNVLSTDKYCVSLPFLFTRLCTDGFNNTVFNCKSFVHLV